MNFSCHTVLPPMFSLADSARPEELAVTVCAGNFWGAGEVIDLWNVYRAGSPSFSLKGSLESADYILAPAYLLEKIFITVTVAVGGLLTAAVAAVRDFVRAFRSLAIYLFDCLFRC